LICINVITIDKASDTEAVSDSVNDRQLILMCDVDVSSNILVQQLCTLGKRLRGSNEVHATETK